jgi:hypothetical protein
MGVRRGCHAYAFGNALGNSIVGKIQADEKAEIDRKERMYGLGGGNWRGGLGMGGGTGRTSAAQVFANAVDAGIRRAALELPSTPLVQDEQLGGGANDVNGMDLQSDQYRGNRRTAVVKQDQGALAALADLGLNDAQRRAALGYLVRTGQIGEDSIVQPGQELHIDTDDTSNGKLGGRVIAQESADRANASDTKPKSWVPYSPVLDSKSEYQARAVAGEKNAQQMNEYADAARKAGNLTVAQQYNDMAAGYTTASQADRETARSITTYTKPMWAGVNPPEFKPSANWSHMGQNSVGYVQGRGLAPDYVSMSGSSHTFSGTVSTNLYDGTIAYGGGVQATNVDPGFRLSPAVSFGWILGVNDAKGVTDFTTGSGTQFGVAIPTPWKLSPSIVINHSYGGAWALELGVQPRTPNTVFMYQPYGYAKELEK